MNHLNEDKRKWITISEYVDITTGEIITKSEYEREYYKVKKPTKTIEYNEKYRIIRYTNECRKHEQTKLFS